MPELTTEKVPSLIKLSRRQRFKIWRWRRKQPKWLLDYLDNLEHDQLMILINGVRKTGTMDMRSRHHGDAP